MPFKLNYTHRDLEKVVTHFESVAADYLQLANRTNNINVRQRRRDQASAYRAAAELLRTTIMTTNHADEVIAIEPAIEPLMHIRG